ncbi:MAG: hydroxymethylbilane synthase [Lachnospiraceae bacterium]
MDRKKVIRIGTRGSRLALAQTDQVIEALKKRYPEQNMEKVILHTQGDKILNKPLIDFGGKGVFITEFEDALQKGEIDLAVHSAKDMPMELADGLVIAGVLPRADARDVLVTKKDIPTTEHLTIGTGSLRRQIQVKQIYPELKCVPIRGNVPTRLQKIQDGVCDGVILAAAGLERLGLLEEPGFHYRYFSYEEMIPAGGQGIIAIEGRENDEVTELAGNISDRNTWMELETERYILNALNADCHEAVGVLSEITDDRIDIKVIREIQGRLCRKQGSTEVENRLQKAKQLVDNL